MNDELRGAIMTEFVALRPKLYSYRKLDGAEDKKCKGIKKHMVKKTLAFDDYKSCLFSRTNGSTLIWQLMFRNKKHEVHTVEVNKVALHRDDDKRIAKRNIVSTLAQGHKSSGNLSTNLNFDFLDDTTLGIFINLRNLKVLT